jgi:GAF domain-containing protein
MFSERLLTIFEVMASRERSGQERGLLCAVAAQITDVSSAGIVLAVDHRSLTPFCASDVLAENLIDLEITVGEGPCLETLDSDDAVAEEDLTFTRNSQWMFYSPSAVELGVRGVFAFPIRIGAIRLGAMCLYQRRPAQLSEGQTTDAMLMASVIGRGIVALQAGARSEALSDELQREATFDFSVHQAAGMLAVQASIDISSTLVALRMHACSLSENLSTVCARVIDRQLRFDSRLQEWREGGL